MQEIISMFISKIYYKKHNKSVKIPHLKYALYKNNNSIWGAST